VWRFPGSNIVKEMSSTDIYQSRGFSSLLLSRQSSAVGPTGVYTCVIPDASDSNTTFRILYIGIYDNDVGG
jgi:hypothetical protein